jgi:excisionase family DNA binding protein
VVGVRVDRVYEALRSGDLAGDRLRGGRWRVDRDEVERWVMSRRVVSDCVPGPARYGSISRRPHVDLLAASELDDHALAEVLGVTATRISRWRLFGVPNLYVARLRQVVEDRHS